MSSPDFFWELDALSRARLLNIGHSTQPPSPCCRLNESHDTKVPMGSVHSEPSRPPSRKQPDDIVLHGRLICASIRIATSKDLVPTSRRIVDDVRITIKTSHHDHMPIGKVAVPITDGRRAIRPSN